MCKVEMSPLIPDRLLPFPLATIVQLAAEHVKASLRRAQERRAALTEPAASQEPNFADKREWEALETPRGHNSTLRRLGHFYFAPTWQVYRLTKHRRARLRNRQAQALFDEGCQSPVLSRGLRFCFRKQPLFESNRGSQWHKDVLKYYSWHLDIGVVSPNRRN